MDSLIECDQCGQQVSKNDAELRERSVKVGHSDGGFSIHLGKIFDKSAWGASYRSKQNHYETEHYYVCAHCASAERLDPVSEWFIGICIIAFSLYVVFSIVG